MCFSATASVCTGLVGLATAMLTTRWSRRFAVFWVVVTSMQFVEAAIHLTLEHCAENKTLAVTLHLCLMTSLLLQPLAYARFVAERSAERAKLLYAHWVAAMLLRIIGIVAYLREGVTHDLFLPENGLVPRDGSTLCISRGVNGHLAWNHGFANAAHPFLPHYADVLLGLVVPAMVEDPANASLLLALDVLAHAVTSRKEGGSVWCAIIHVQLIVELAKYARWRWLGGEDNWTAAKLKAKASQPTQQSGTKRGQYGQDRAYGGFAPPEN